MLKYIQDLCRGSPIRDATLQSVVDEYSDFASAYRDVEKLKIALSGSFNTFDTILQTIWKPNNLASTECVYH